MTPPLAGFYFTRKLLDFSNRTDILNSENTPNTSFLWMH